jgi:PKD repeat protein
MLVKSDVLWKKFTLKNNIWCGKNYGFDKWSGALSPMDWDYDCLYRAAGNFARIDGTTYPQIADFRAGTGYLINGRDDWPDLVDPDNGDYTLAVTSTSIDAGVVLPGINEGYNGVAPDLGAYEYTPAAALSITTASLAGGTVGAAYSDTLAATGGTPPYTWSITVGSLPGGLGLNASTGEISGTCTATGTFNFTVQVEDSLTATDTQALSITVAASAVTVTTASVPGGTEGAAYSQALAASGGITPYRWYVSSGALPDGLSLNSATGTISGVSFAPGTYDFTVKVWDSQILNTFDTQALSIVVAAADTDGDSLPDGWEMEHFGDLDEVPGGDADGDGYLNLTEYRNGTDPDVAASVAPYLESVEWISVGPGGGGAQYNPAIAPNNPDLQFGFCDMGGIYRSKDGGRNWRMYTAQEVQFPVAYSPTHCRPAFHPFDENIVFLGAWQGLNRSTDGGDTWTLVHSTGYRPNAIAIDRADTNYMFYADSDNRMYASTDGGTSWAEVTSWRSTINLNARDIFIDASTPTGNLTVYAYTSTGLYKTVDGGTTWAGANGDLPSTSLDDFNGGMMGGAILYVTVDGLGVFKSTNGGVNWVAKNNGFNVGAAGHMELGLCESDPDVLYVGSQENAGPTIYKSTDGGDNWAIVLIDPGSGKLPGGITIERDWMTLDLGWGWGEEAHEIEVCPTDPRYVAFAEDGRTWRSNDGGQSWFCCNSRETSPSSDWWPSRGFETTTNYRVLFTPWDHDRAYISYTDIGSFRSEDRGYSWRYCASGVPYRNTFYDIEFDPTIPGKMWAVCSNHHDLPHDKMLRRADFLTFTGAVLVSTDYGVTWTNLGHPVGVNMGAMTDILVDPTSTPGSRTLYVTVCGRGVHKSTDDGVTWAPANTGLSMPNNMNAWQLRRMPDGTLYCALTMSYVSGTRYAGGLFKSTDNAANWTQINTSQELPYICGFDVDPGDQNRIYVASFQKQYDGQHGFYRTGDGGTNWTKTFNPGDMYGADIDPELTSRVYTTLEQGEDFWGNGGIYVSEDYGNTFTKIPGFPHERYGPNYVNFDPDDSQIIFVTTFGGGIFKATVPHAVAPAADFAATAGPADLQETFDSSACTGDINTYYWEFGDGNISFDPNPVHTYAAAGTYSVTLTVQGPAGTDNITKNVSAAAILDITTAVLPDGVVGSAYSQTVASIGGTAPLTWTVTAGALPDGLGLNAGTGEISGVPTTAATYNFTITATDSGVPTPQADSQALQIVVQPSGLAVTTPSLPDGTVGVAYSSTLAASGGVPPYTWSITVGTLPDGLSLNSGTGAITGTPTAYGTWGFTVQVEDSSAVPQTATRPLAITIQPEALVITTATLPDGQVSVAYSQTLAATGGATPYAWSVIVGVLPDGLSLNGATGEISGTPTAYGLFNFTVQVDDSWVPTNTATQALSITVNPETLVVTTASLPDGQVGAAYSQTLAATGGVTPYSWSVVVGALPAGLALNASTGEISGTPTAVETASFTVEVTDSQGVPATDQQALSINVIPAPLVVTTDTLPDGQIGAAYSQTLAATGGVAPYTWAVIAGALPDGLTLNAATGEISGTPTVMATFGFTVEVTDSQGVPETATKALSITINAETLVITTASLPAGTVASAYSETLAATGGVTPYSWAITAGVLPTGVTLNATTGEISGVPAEDGTFDITVEVTDSDAPAATASQALSLVVNPSLPAITTLSVPGGTEGVAYSTTLAATGGLTPYRWYVMGGALPDGLALDRVTGEIAGVPFESGTFDFTVKVWDAQILNESDTQALTVTVAAADTDADGMGDGWEIKYFGDLSAGPVGDGDSDGYFNLTEYRNGTNPSVTETVQPYLSTVEWLSVGLGGGGSQANPMIAPNNPDLMFGVCDMGGFYRSIDGGRHWEMVNGTYVNGVPPYSPDDCAPEFHRQDELIALASRNGGLARTADGGLTWTTVSAVRASAIAFHAGDSSYVLFAGEDDNLYESTDAGATWVEETGWSSVALRIRELYVDPTTATGNATLYASTASGVYKSTDGGATWTPKNTGLGSTDISQMDAGMANGALVLYCLAGNAVYKTTDGADSWSDVTSDLPTTSVSGPTTYTSIGVAWSDADVAYVGSDFEWGPSIHKTTNGGTSWTLKLCHIESGTLPVTTTVERDWLSIAYDWGWGGPVWNVNVCPTDPNRVAFCEYARTFRSDNGGDHWFCSNVEEAVPDSNWWRSVGFETTTCYKYVVDPRQASRHYICYTDIGFARSEDSDDTWQWSATGSPWQNTFYEIACDPTAAGRIWAAVSNSHDIPGWAKVGQDPDTFTGGVVISADWGVTWSDVGHATGLPTGAVTSILVDPTSPEASRTVYAVVFGKGVYKSTDGGVNWVEKNTGLTMGTANTNIYRIERTADGTLYCAITHRRLTDGTRLPGGLFKSTDGGDNWAMINTGYDLYYIQGFSIDPTDNNRIYVGLAHPGGGVVCASGIVRSIDGGASWENPLSSLDSGVAWHVVADPEEPSRVWAAVNSGYSDPDGEGLHMSDDYGATWTQVPTFPFTNIGGIRPCFDPADSQILYVTTYGGGVFKGVVPHATAPVADFDATAGPADLQVTFDSSVSTGTINTWYWEFGDGNTSFLANPVHTYAAAGTYSVTLYVQGSAGTDSITMNVSAAAILDITTTTLPDGMVGSAYSQTIASTGGTAPLTWAVTAGALPAGLGLNPSTGEISGAATTAATYNFTITATDSGVPTAQVDSQALQIIIQPSDLAVTTASLPDGQVAVAYSQTLAATGGVPGYSWAVIVGALPDGLGLNGATGEISGAPTAYGTWAFTVEVTDSSAIPQTATQALSITVIPIPLIITTASLPDGQVGVAYSQTLAATGGATPYAWSVIVGVLPDGLSLNGATGEISGTATAYGTFNFTVQVDDSWVPADTATQALSITVIPADLAITTASLPDGQVGVVYSQTLAATGGATPYTWSVILGALPDGLGLNGATGEISGTATAYGTFAFTIQVDDSWVPADTATQALSITVIPETLVVTTASLPDGQVGVAYSQTLAATGGAAPYTWSVIAGVLPDGLGLNGATGEISGTATAYGTFAFTVQVDDSWVPANTATGRWVSPTVRLWRPLAALRPTRGPSSRACCRMAWASMGQQARSAERRRPTVRSLSRCRSMIRGYRRIRRHKRSR